MEERRLHPLELGKDGYIKVQAPMVRYSKVAFRCLVKEYNADLLYTPMIISDVFRNSALSRDAEFTTNQHDCPVVVQFAATNGKDAADAAELVAKHSNGVDINCGCPQQWAINEGFNVADLRFLVVNQGLVKIIKGIGSALLKKPEVVQDIVRQVKERTSTVKMSNGKSFPCSIKIRVDKDIRKTIELCKRAESVGVDWISVHGRTVQQKNAHNVNKESIKMVKESLSIPVFANGGIASLKDADEMVKETNADGVMVAQGLLDNPALFAGYDHTPYECVQKYIRNAVMYGTTTFIFHHHLMFMLSSQMSRAEKRHFNQLYSIPAILDYLQDHHNYEFL